MSTMTERYDLDDVAGAAEQLKGGDWRTTVTTALHRLEVDRALCDPPDDTGGDLGGVPARI